MYFSCAYPHLVTLCLLAVKFSVILILHMLTKLCSWYPGDRRNLLQLLTKMQGFSRPCCRTNIMHAWKNKQHYSNKTELITDILMLTFLLKSVWFLEGFINFQIRSLPPSLLISPTQGLMRNGPKPMPFAGTFIRDLAVDLKCSKIFTYLCVDLHVTFLLFMVQ